MKRLLALWLGLLLTAAAPYAPPQGGTRTVYRHAALIDGTGAPLRRDMAVVVEGERIAAVAPDAALTPAQLAGARQVDASGRWLLPGLIDSHQHLATPPDRPAAEASLRRALYSGVTAVRDMADDLRQVGDLARAARVGEIASPDIYYAALMAGPGFFGDVRTQAAAQGAEAGRVPWMQAVDARTDLRLAVALARGTSASAIKVYADLPAASVRAIVAEAHRQGVPVWAHGMVFPATPEEVVRAGADTVSHVCYLAYQGMARRPASYGGRFPLDAAEVERNRAAMAALFAEMRRRGTILDATLVVYRSVEAQARIAGKPPLCTTDFALRWAGEAMRAGVRISAGTDAETPPSAPWPALFDEIELLGRAGMTPLEAIEAATLNGARAANQGRDMGSVEAGKLANLVILARDPLESLSNLRSVVLIVKRGREFRRADAGGG